MTILPPIPQAEPLARLPTAVVEPGSDTPSFRIGHRATYKHQYSNIYWQRLRTLRSAIQEVAHKRWGQASSSPKLVKRVLDVEKKKICYVVGTVYMDMPLKPNVMEAIARDSSIAAPPPPPKIFSPDDNVMLEDESGRVHLTGDCLKTAGLVTGVIIGALGMEGADGSFEAVDICTAGLVPQPSLQEELEKQDEDVDMNGTSEDDDPWIAAVSGLNFGADASTDAQVQMLVEFLTGEGGVVRDQASVSRISRLIIAGDSLAPITTNIPETAPTPEDKKAKRYGYDSSTFSPHPIHTLSSTLFDLASSLPIHILPGENDPSGAILPQQPFPRAMFGNASRFSTLSCETNPTYLTITSDTEPSSATPKRPSVTRSLLVNSGQPLNDIFKYLPTPPNTRLSMLESTLRWRHMAPTAPDTLWCHPYSDGDPFLIQQTPDLYIVGGQKKFATKLITEHEHKGSRRQGKLLARSRIVMVPSFARTGILVLINLRNLNVRCVNFAVKGMTSGGLASGAGDEGKVSRAQSPILEESMAPEMEDSSQPA